MIKLDHCYLSAGFVHRSNIFRFHFVWISDSITEIIFFAVWKILLIFSKSLELCELKSMNFNEIVRLRAFSGLQ